MLRAQRITKGPGRSCNIPLRAIAKWNLKRLCIAQTEMADRLPIFRSQSKAALKMRSISLCGGLNRGSLKPNPTRA
jgi:hypothetical protein